MLRNSAAARAIACLLPAGLRASPAASRTNASQAQPASSLFAELLASAGQGSDAARARAIGELRNPKAPAPGTDSVNELLRLCADSGDVAGGLEVLAAMERRGLASSLDFVHLDALFRYFPRPMDKGS